MNVKEHLLRTPEIREFERLALESFAFLSMYGFGHNCTDVLMPDIEVRFRNSTTEITIVFQIGSTPFVELGRLAALGGGPRKVEYYDMAFLLMERAPAKLITRYRCELGDPRIPTTLCELAALLGQYARDILQGDFSIFPQLKALTYREAAISQFKVLERWGLSYFQTDISLPHISVRFRSTKTEIAVECKIGSCPRVKLGRLTSREGTSEVSSSFDFRSLLRRRAPDEEREMRWDDPFEPNIPYALEKLAALLQQYAPDVLKGDFSTFENLKAQGI